MGREANAAHTNTAEAVELTITGIVQGVGFRPFVYRQALEHNITGWVLNNVAGVTVHAEGASDAIDQFIIALSERAPQAASVKEIAIAQVALEGFDAFEIRFSEHEAAEETTLVSPDLATCDECVAELFDPENRRYHYPFINCTNCGPRFTIIRELPYDRPATSMQPFAMCPQCAAEYADPANRRFHAQPDACFECGPSVGWIEVGPTDAGAAGPTDAGAARSAGVGAAKAVRTTLQVEHISWAKTREESDAVFVRAAALLREGGIVAVKGLGGYHLACDAQNAQAIATLRARKHREGKAFAVMVASVAAAREYCTVSAEEQRQLEHPARPIVLLQKKPGAHFAASLADALPELGVMLPATPVQHLLLHEFGGMLVMTSGNIHDEPIVTTEEAAFEQLGRVADAFLVNNRVIEGRYDDSVLRVLDAGAAGSVVQMVRRARGYAPQPVALPQAGTQENTQEGAQTNTQEDMQADAPAGAQEDVRQGAHSPDAPEGTQADAQAGAHVGAQNKVATGTPGLLEVFATGSEQKNTFTYARGNQAFVSQHIGDVESVAVMDAWDETRMRFGQLFKLNPQRVACDYHPEYLTSKWAHAQSLPVVQVQHHHAHILSVMGENNLEGPVCGFAFDGTGYGLDGAVWGGEVLLSNLQAYERFANFAYVPLPGGAGAIKHPARIAYGVLWAFDLLEHPVAQRFVQRQVPQAQTFCQMIEAGINCPYTSSAGRLFDAASALLGCCIEPRYEGEAAILLEAALHESMREGTLAGLATPDAAAPPTAAAANQAASAGHVLSPAELGAYPINLIKNSATATSTAADTSVILMDTAPTFEALLNDMQAGVPVATCALRFHEAFVEVIANVAEVVRGIYDINTVALAGGVFMNRYVAQRCIQVLHGRGFTVAVNRDLPPNDAAVSYGQAVLALHAQPEE